jgi:hypothetical protein
MEKTMRLVKRTAITLKPKQPYFDWANHLDDGPKIDAETSSEASIYLLEDDSDFEFDLEALLSPHYKEIFEEELVSWHRVKADWPVARDLATFLTWFDVEVHSMVFDLVGGALRTERYDGS